MDYDLPEGQKQYKVLQALAAQVNDENYTIRNKEKSSKGFNIEEFKINFTHNELEDCLKELSQQSESLEVNLKIKVLENILCSHIVRLKWTHQVIQNILTKIHPLLSHYDVQNSNFQEFLEAIQQAPGIIRDKFSNRILKMIREENIQEVQKDEALSKIRQALLKRDQYIKRKQHIFYEKKNEQRGQQFSQNKEANQGVFKEERGDITRQKMIQQVEASRKNDQNQMSEKKNEQNLTKCDQGAKVNEQQEVEKLKKEKTDLESKLDRKREIFTKIREKSENIKHNVQNVSAYLLEAKKFRQHFNQLKDFQQKNMAAIQERFEKFTKSFQQQNPVAKNNGEGNHFFCGSIFSGLPYRKERMTFDYGLQRENLIALVQEQTGKKIRSTKLMYHMDNITPKNFHQYLDGVPHILLVIRLVTYSKQTEKDNILVAYSEKGISKETMENQKGFISCLTKKNMIIRPDPQKTNYRITLYDPYYIIFGNSDIRIPIGTNPNMSSIIKNRYSFFEKKYTIKQLTDSDQKQMDIDQYEIFHINFSS